MNPDYHKMVEELVKPVILLSAIIITGLAISIGWQIWKENMDYRRRLGRD